MKSCPVASCDAADFLDGDELYDHLVDEHDQLDLAKTVIKLARGTASARAHTECQICGNYGATPGDHPLCGSCEKGLRR
ncbi:hypothetical protein BX265_7559 [Streptomyces sp. TLI_235]|nr:hypothetical protein [Streptomyces sp. TLI_235]PBC70166.1 hypothetical protein BX265_7559 [Streptomyces sp. TLI_235]